MKTIYADNAATTYPRPPQVIRAMSSYLRDIGCNPGRGGTREPLTQPGWYMKHVLPWLLFLMYLLPNR